MTPSPIGDSGAPDTKRLLLTVGIISVMFLAWKVVLPSPAPAEKPPAEAAAAPDGTKATPTTPTTPTAPTAVVPALVEGVTPDDAEEQIHALKVIVADAPGQTSKVIEGDVEAKLTTRGGQLSQYVLTGYKDTAKIDPKTQKAFTLEKAPVVDLVTAGHLEGPDKGAHLFTLKTRGGDVSLASNANYELAHADKKSAVFTRLTASGVRVTRTYTFNEGSFVVDHKVELSNEGPKAASIELDLLMTAQEHEGTRGGSMFAAASDELTAVCRGEDKEKWTVTDLEDDLKKGKPTALLGASTYAGLDRHYFLASVLPKAPGTIQGCSASPWKESASTATAKPENVGTPTSRSGVDVTVSHKPVQLAPGQKHVIEHRLFLGPKQIDILSSVDPLLEENVDFGIFGILSKPILFVLMKIYGVVGNFAIAIILLTLLIKLLTFPLNQKSYVSMQAMKTLAPEMKELEKKYGHDRTLKGQKQMEMYKEKGVSPMAGCFPMLLQMPIWFALYRTLWSSVELFQQPGFAWINDLSVPDPSPLGIPVLPFIVGALMLGQTMFQPPPAEQPQMKYVMWGMPVMFTFFMFGMPSGLSIYMITNSVLTMAQQYYIKRKYPVPAAPETADVEKKAKA